MRKTARLLLIAVIGALLLTSQAPTPDGRCVVWLQRGRSSAGSILVEGFR